MFKEKQNDTKDHHWFKGSIEGDYVGKPSTHRLRSDHHDAQSYAIQIYRADVSITETFDTAQTNETTQNSFKQNKIKDALIVDPQNQTSFEGPIHDLHVYDVDVLWSTIHDNKVYGRIKANVQGHYVKPKTKNANPKKFPFVKQADQAGPEDRIKQIKGLDVETPGQQEQRSHSFASKRSKKREQRDRLSLPVFAILVAVGLFIASGWWASLLWLGFCTPIMMIRLLLADQFQPHPGHQTFGAALLLVQCGLLGFLAFLYWQQGCLPFHLGITIGVGLTVLVSSFLPNPQTLIFTSSGFAFLLYLFFTPHAFLCQPPSKQKSIHDVPTVKHPGIPRTNADGSWPRRPPGR